MPFVTPPVSADLETLELDGLHLNSDEIGLEGVTFPPPRERQNWIGAADSEYQVLADKPKHENREITAQLVVVGGDKDGMLQRVGEIVDKLNAASSYPDGIPLIWSPGGSTLEVTFDVLSGEITDMAVDLEWNLGNVAKLTVVLKAKPYWYGEETLTGTTSSSTPHVTAEIENLTGDIPALGRLIVTDTATQSRRFVEWGLEGPLTYDDTTSLLITSDDMVTAGFAGSGSTQSGAYDPNGAGNNVILMSLLGPQAMCGFSGTHTGVFRVKGRFYLGTTDPGSTRIRLVWKDQDNPQSFNAYAPVIVGEGWNSLDLGTITVSGAWSGYIEASSPYYTENLRLNFIELVPVTDGYGKARATYTYQPGVTVGRDEFTGSTAAAVLHTATSGRAATSGGNWVTSGDATDFAYADDLGGEQVKRSVTGATGRFAILGSSNFADTESSVRVYVDGTPFATIAFGLVARWVDSSNYLRFRCVGRTTGGVIEQVVSGSATTIASTGDFSFLSSTWYRLRLLAFASGRTIGQILDSNDNVVATADGSSSTLATGGTLDDGKPGFWDRSTSLTTTRYYDEFAVATPASDPVVVYSGQSLTVDHEKVERENAAGTANGKPQAYRGSRFLVPVGTSRALVRLRRNDVETAADDNVTDATQVQFGITPRGLVVPRA